MRTALTLSLHTSGILKRTDVIEFKSSGWWNIPETFPCKALAGKKGRGEELEMIIEGVADEIVKYLESIGHWSLVVK
jgi:hypothetical protein